MLSISRFLKSEKIKPFLPVALVFGVIVIVKGGYEAGIWLYDVLH